MPTAKMLPIPTPAIAPGFRAAECFEERDGVVKDDVAVTVGGEVKEELDVESSVDDDEDEAIDGVESLLVNDVVLAGIVLSRLLLGILSSRPQVRVAIVSSEVIENSGVFSPFSATVSLSSA